MGSLFKKKKSQPAGLTPQLFQELCRDGERGDQLIGQGKADEGQQILGTVFRRMLEAGAFDEFLLAKLCLSSILSSIVTDRVSTAHAIWTGKLPGPPGKLYAVGINAIETGVLDLRDTLIYQSAGAFLHACNADINAARKSVDHVMRSVVDGAVEHMPEAKESFVGHWKYCLTRVYDDDPAPSDLYSQLGAVAKEHDITVPDRGKLAIIKPSDWKTETDIVGVVG